jgi:hypothetical protein
VAVAVALSLVFVWPVLGKDKENRPGTGNAYGQENGNDNGGQNQNNGNHYGTETGQGNPPPSQQQPAPSSSPEPPASAPSTAPSTPTTTGAENGSPSASSVPSAIVTTPSSGAGTDQDAAVRAVEDLRALPLETIATKVHETTPGEIIDAQLITVDGFLLYEVKVLDGERLSVDYYYARSGNKVGD